MPSLNTGNAILSNAIAVSSTYNVGIGGAASGSHKLQVTGATNLTGKLTINTGGTDDQFQLVGTAPSYRMTNAVTGATINGFIAMAGATNNYITGAVSGDMCIGNQNNGKILFGFGAGTATPKMTIDSNGAATFSSTATATAFIPSGSSVPSNGVYLPSANTLGFSTNTTERMRINSSGSSSFSGNVNINDTYGLYMGVGGEQRILAGGTTVNTYLTFSSWTGSAYAERMRITSGGNVGIGTSSPSSFAGYNNLSLQASTSGYNLDFFNNSGVRRASIIYNNAVNFTLSAIESIPMIFETAGVERMKITSGGVLQIQPATGFPTTGSGLEIYLNASDLGIQAYNRTSSAWNNLVFKGLEQYFFTNGTERMRISSDGQVLLHSTAFNSNIIGQLFGNSGDTYFTTSEITTLVLNRKTTNGEIIRFQYNGSTVGSISTNSNSLPSDLNFKKDITDLSLGLNLVSKLRPVHYRHKMDNKDEALSNGIIAQELEQSLLECGIQKNTLLMLQHKPNDIENESQYWVDYTKMIPILIKAIQEQQAQIEAQQQQIHSLINR